MRIDFSAAYENSAHIPDGAAFPARWSAAALAFRAVTPALDEIRYGQAPRQTADLFLPQGQPCGLAIFIHGGYWMETGKADWSHLAAGALARGWAVGLPQYTLSPEAGISQITVEVGRAVEALAARVAGPIRLAGHSAGGHLASRMACTDAPLAPAVQARIAQVLSISGLHDLRPLLWTAMNTTLGMDEAEARAESPALLRPVAGLRLTAWVGADERPEFRRQTDLLANIWSGLGALTQAVHEAGCHHFDVIDGLSDPDSPLCRSWLA